MTELQVRTRTTGTTTLKEETIEAFKQMLRGRLLTPESQQYDEARTIWNAMIDRRPGLITVLSSQFGEPAPGISRQLAGQETAIRRKGHK